MFTKTHTTRTAKRVGIGATALGAGAAALVLAAPAASAATLDIVPGPLLGSSQFGTSCTYDVNVSVTGNSVVYLYDNNVSLSPQPVQPSGGIAPFKWTPTSPGLHTLTAYQFGSGNPTTVSRLFQVGTGVNLGSACPVF